MITLTIPLTAPSLNKWYAGGHWSIRKKTATLWHTEVIWACKLAKIKPIIKFPVKITTHSFFKTKRRRDVSNTATAPKLIEDGLVEAGIMPDDNLEYVVSHTLLMTIGHDKNETVITIEEV